MGTDQKQLTEDFQTYGLHVSDEQILEKCFLFCETYDLTGEQLAVCWLDYAAYNDCEEMTLQKLACFEKERLTQQKESKFSPSVETPEVLDQTEFYEEDDDLLMTYGAPAISSARKLPKVEKKHISTQDVIGNSPGVGTPSQRYSSRKNSNILVCSFGDCSNEEWSVTSSQPRVTIHGDTFSTNSYMFEKLRMCSIALDDAIGDMGDQLKSVLGIEEWTHVRSTSNEDCWFIGRICCDSVGKLNSASLLLEGCQEISQGNIVKLDVSQLTEYSLFPGQIVAVYGKNPSGNTLVVSQINDGLILPKASGTNLEDTIIRIACGPFTTSDNLLFEPLDDLLKTVIENPPHVLILLGPLLDATHKLLTETQLDETYDAIVERCAKIISTKIQNTKTQVYIVASSKDVSCDFVYPTPPYQIQGIQVLPDPVVLDINGYKMGLTSTDALLHLTKEEISIPPCSGDRLTRISRHILKQQSFYPLYPGAEDLNISLPNWSKYCHLDFTPDVLVLPSDLRYFVKDVEGCVVLNPEKLTKGLVGGCYANIRIHNGNIYCQIYKV